MKRTIERITRTAMLAVAFMLCATSAWAAAPTATVVWESDFGTTKTVDGSTFEIVQNSASIDVNGNLAIGASTDNTYTSPTLAIPEAFQSDKITVLIKYSGLAAYSGANAALSSVKAEYGGSSIVYGLRSNGSGHLDLIGYNESTSGVQSLGSTVSLVTGAGYYLVSTDTGEGVYGYTGTHVKGLSGSSTALKKDSNYKVTSVSLGGSHGVNRAYAWAGVTIEKVAIFIGNAYSNTDLADYVWPSAEKYRKWTYAQKVYTWDTSNDTSDIGSSGNGTLYLFDVASGKNTSTTLGSGGDNWRQFCIGQTQYSAPGCALRFISSSAGKTFTGGFDPLTFGGIIVESDAGGLSIGTANDGRKTVFGAASGATETWFRFDADASVKRSGAFRFSGNVNLDIAKQKTLTLTAAGSPAIVASVTSAAMTTTAGGALKMHGLGKLAVSTLTATGGATLDFSDVQEDADVVRSTTPFIQGNLTIDATTKFVFPAGLAKETAYTLCSGTLTAPASVVCDITVGTTVKKNVLLTFSGNTVSYVDLVYAATVDGTTVTWDGDEPSSFDDIVVTFSGSGTVTGLSGSGTTINAAAGVTVDVTSFTSPTLLGTGTFRYTSGYPTTIPSAEYSYEYVGGATVEASVTIPGVTVNGVLKTSGYLTLTTFSLPSGCSLDVLDGSTKVQGSTRALKGDVTVRYNATLVYGSNDLLDYSGSTHADIYGTLEIDGSTTRLLNQSSNMELNFYGGSTIKGSGFFNIAKDQGFNVKVNPDDGTKDTVSFQTRLRYNANNSTSTITVDEGVTLSITAGSVFAFNGNTAGSITKAGGGKIVFGSGCDASDFATTLNVNAGEAEISNTFGGTVVVASAATLTVSGASPSITQPLTLRAGSTLAYRDDSQTITTSGALSLPASGKVTVDVSNLTIAANASKELLTVGSGSIGVNKFTQIGNTETHVLSASGQTLSLVPIAATVTKSTGTVSYATLNEAVMELNTSGALEPDAYVTLVNASSSDLTISAEELASAGIVYDESDGTYGFAAAEISSTKYTTVAKAIAAAASSGDTVTLLRDCTVTDLSLAGKTITLDEGDYTFSGSFTGNGTLIMTAMPKAISSSRWSAGWTGTLWLKGVSFSNLNPGKCGNVNSTLKMTGCSGSFNEAHDSGNTFAGALELEDEGVTPALTINEGFPLHGYTSIGALKGSGTLTSGDTQRAQCFRFVDASEFEGAITISDSSYMRVVFGSGSTNYKSEAYRKIIVEEGASATIAAGKNWSAPGGVVVDGTLTLATSTSALSGAVTGSGRVVFVNALPSSSLQTSFQDSANWTGTVELRNYEQKTEIDAHKIINLNNYGNSNSTVALNGVTSTMFAASNNATYPAVTLKEIEIGEGGWTDNSLGQYNADMLYTAKLTGNGPITVKTTGSGTVKFVGNHTFDGSVSFGDSTGKQVAFMKTAGDTLPSVTAKAIVVAGRSNMSIASGKTWTAPGGIKIDGSLTVLTAEATTATSVTPTAYKDGAQIETSEDAIAGTTTYATGMVVSNQDSMGDVTVIGGQSISGSGGTYMSSLTINDGATLTYDPVITPIRVESAPVFNGTGKLKLAARYAGVTCGKFHLVSYPSSASVSGTLADLVDSTSFNNASYTVTEETVGSYKQLVLKVGDYDTNAKAVSIAQFGDSITEGIWRSGYRGTPNYRIPLMQLLEAYGYRPEARGYRSVGSTDANGVPADDNYKWHTGISAQRIYTGHTTTGTPSDANLRAGFMESIEAHLEQVGVTDIITLKIGTNDSIGNETADNMFEGWTNLVWKIVRMRPTSKIVVCAPVKIRTGENNAPGLRTKIAEYMALTPEQGGFPAGQVTMINGINIVTDDANYYLTDNVHPNWNGHLQLANAWLPAVTNAFESMTARATTGYTAQTVASAADAAELAAYRAGYVKLATFTNFDTKLNTWGETPYSYVNNDYKDTPMGRVAYFVARKTTASPDTRYVWVDMDADATTGTTLASFGVPTSASVNGVVNNLHIYSNSSAIENVAPTVSGVKGTLMRTEKGVDKADGISTDLAPTGPYGFDWNDTINGSGAWGVLNMARIFDGATPTNHRKLLAAQMLFDFNGFNGGRQNALGIGDFAVHGPYNYANDSVDHFNLNWTFTTDKDEMPTMDARALETGVIEIWGKPLYTATIDSDADFSEVAETVGLPVDASACDLVINVTADSTLTFGSALSVGSITFNIAENKTLTLASESNITVGKVTVNGPGKLQLSSSGTFGRMEVASNATVGFADGATLTVSGALSVASGATLTLEPVAISTASSTIISAASISGTVSVTLPSESGVDYSTIATETSYKIVRTPNVAFSYDGTIGAAPTGWFTAWGGEGFGDRLRVGPNSGRSIVYEVYHDSNEVKAHPYYELSARSAFSFALYADVSQVGSDGRKVLASFGKSSAGLVLYRQGDCVRVGHVTSTGFTGDWAAAVEIPASGYHLYTVTYDPNGTIALYLDDGASSSSRSALGEMSLGAGMQIGGMYQGVPTADVFNDAVFAQGVGMAFAAIRCYDSVLAADNVKALAKQFPATDGTQMTFSVQPNASGKTLTVYSSAETVPTSFGPSAGSVVIPSGNTVSVTNLRTYPNGGGGEAINSVTINGTLNVSAVDTAVNDSDAGKGVVLGYWVKSGSANTKTTISVSDGGVLNAQDAYVMIPWSGKVKEAKLEISGGTARVKGLYCNGTAGVVSGQVNLSNGGTLEVATIPAGGRVITKNFGKGTFRINANATEGRAINFQGDSAENATVLDPNGHTLTLAAAAVTGSGYIKIASGTTGTVVFNGGSFTGTVIIDANAATVQGTIPGTLKSGVADNCVCSVTANATTTYYPTFASAIEAAGENEITVYGYNNEALPDHYRVKDGKLELIPGTIFSVW